VNSPTFFKACWSIIKRWVSDLTASKVIFVSRRKLAGCIDDNQVAAEVGVKDSSIKAEPDEEDAAMEAAAQGDGASPLPSPPPGTASPVPPAPGEHHNKNKCEICNVAFSKTFGIVSGRSHCRVCMKSVCKSHCVVSATLKEKVCTTCEAAANAPKSVETPAADTDATADGVAAADTDATADGVAALEV